MTTQIRIFDREFNVDLGSPIDISIPLEFNGPQPNVFGVERATSAAVATQTLVGDTRRGGSCNFESVTLIPHCNGTHTECVGHITHERISLRDCLQAVFLPAILVTVAAESARASGENYPVDFEETDQVITQRALQNAFSTYEKCMEGGVKPSATAEGIDMPRPPKALVVRTMPNDEGKKSAQYG
ncbi:MAG: cyclase family protein, partial [Acidobacteria bacterium]|nr:cyclase family protein [Acidobacteriota bacterium]